MVIAQQSESQAPAPQPSMQQKASRLVPYVKLNHGGWSVADKDVLDYIDQAHEEGVIETVFYSGSNYTREKVWDYLKTTTNLVVFVFEGHKIVGAAWLNGLTQKHGFGHFCFVSSASDATASGRAILDYWNGFQAMEVIIGIVPVSNQKAIHYVKKLGFREVGEIPKMLNVGGMPEAGVIFHRVCR